MDIKYFDAFPRFLYDREWMYAKHLEGLFNERILDMDMAYEKDEVAFDRLTDEPKCKEQLAEQWTAFLSEVDVPPYAFAPGYVSAPISRTMPWMLREFKQFLQENYGEDIDVVNRKLGTEYLGWNSVFVTPPSCLLRREMPTDDEFTEAFHAFAQTVPYGLRYYHSPQGFFIKQVLKTQYGLDIQDYNRKHGTSYGSYSEVRLAREYPAQASELARKDWEQFIRNTLALQWIRVAPEALPEYHDFLRTKHQTIKVLNSYYETAYTSFEDIPLIEDPPLSGMALTDWEAFIAGWKDPIGGKVEQVSAKYLRVHSVEFMFQDWLIDKYGSIDGVNAALATAFPDKEQIIMPQEDLHRSYFLSNVGSLRWEFVTRNYKTVADYMLFHGRGILNTVVYCTLAILSALLVNPLAAYAMSRYKMPSSYKILLFLMCTMAFPPMVTSIPNFLMLRKLGLLNTFAALILPGMANGYSIFLLKGFFDAQPQELYESAQLDGASEWTLFWRITMSLSKPILAVIALQAFTLAYSNFMFAFVVCQDEKMWTLMVWLYQLQQRSGQAVMYASLIIAAIPTFLIFLFCQNIIMRGIVVPSEK
jgi:multiple sugar transport system permease protein